MVYSAGHKDRLVKQLITEETTTMTYVVSYYDRKSLRYINKLNRGKKLSSWTLKTKEHHKTVLLNGFHLNGHTLGIHPQS